MAEQTRVIAPVAKPKAKDKTTRGDGGESPCEAASPAPVTDAHQSKPGDSPAVGDWREATEEAKALYKDRAATAECVNAQARNRNLVLLPLRGLKKVRGVALLYALAHNLMRMISLAPELLGIGTGASAIREMAA